MTIDAHQHFWQLERGDYGWLTPALAGIFRDFMPEDLSPLLAARGIKGTILVQAAPTRAETNFLLDIAARTDFVLGVVGWVDFEAPDAAETIARLAENPLLVGLRPMLHDLDDPDWITRPELAPAIAAMTEASLVFDALVRPQHLPALTRFARRHPDLSIVVDHGGKPAIARGIWGDWARDLAMLAGLPQVTCKLSGLVTEAGRDWTPAQIQPVIAHLLSCFGADRLLFGSDWPVCLLAADYAAWHDLALAALRDLMPPEHARVFGGNARKIYLSRRGKRRACDADRS